MARNGRAEVLRELGRIEDALGQYEETCRRFSDDRVAINGRACVLLSLGRLDEALSLVPERTTRSRHDWIDEHVRGMILLRQGDLTQAIAVFERGLRECPFTDCQPYYRYALAVAQLRRGKLEEAEAALADARDEVADVLRLEVYGRSHSDQQARAAYERLQSVKQRAVRQLRDRLAAPYVFRIPKALAEAATPAWQDDVFREQCELITIRRKLTRSLTRSTEGHGVAL